MNQTSRGSAPSIGPRGILAVLGASQERVERHARPSARGLRFPVDQASCRARALELLSNAANTNRYGSVLVATQAALRWLAFRFSSKRTAASAHSSRMQTSSGRSVDGSAR